MHTISQMGGTDEWKAKVENLSTEDWRLLNIPSFRKNEEAKGLKNRLYREVIEEAGGTVRTVALGRIGNGTKTHRLIVYSVELTDFRGKGVYYTQAYDGCSSSKWNCYRSSTLYVLGEYDETQVTCKKCIK